MRSLEQLSFQYLIVCLLVLLNCILSTNSRFIGLETNISKNIDVNPEKNYSCKRKCYEQYSRCEPRSTGFPEQIVCMKTKLNCQKRCADLQLVKTTKKLRNRLAVQRLF